MGHGNIIVVGVQLERDGVLTDAGKAEGSVLIGINRNTEETEKILWDSSQSQTVDASLDHRLLSEEGRNQIKNDFVDSVEFGQDIARATGAVKKEDNLNITDFWTTLDNNTKATQIKNELTRNPEYASIIEGLNSQEDFPEAFEKLGKLAQEKFGINAEEFGKIFLYDGSKTTSTSLAGTETKGGIVTDKNNQEYGNIFVNTNSGIKTDMINTLGHETVELFTLTTNGKNDAAQEAQASIFGEQFSSRINQAAGGNLDASSGSNFTSNLNNNWSVLHGTFQADNVGDASVDHRTGFLKGTGGKGKSNRGRNGYDPFNSSLEASLQCGGNCTDQPTLELPDYDFNKSLLGEYLLGFKSESDVFGKDLSQDEIFDRLQPGQAYERNGTYYIVSDTGGMHVTPKLPTSGTEYTVLDPYELAGNTSAGGYQPTTLDPITTLSFPASENQGSTYIRPPAEDLGAHTLINPISDFENPLNTAGGNGTPVEVVTVMMSESDEPVRVGDVELYKDTIKRAVVGDGLTGDHQPSYGSILTRVEEELGDELSPSDRSWLRANTGCLVVTGAGHCGLSNSYGGRNTAERQYQDSLDLRAAADRDFDAMIPDLKTEGLTNSQINSRREDLHKINTDAVRKINERFGTDIRY